jgi:hypothetical protein
MNHLAMTTRIEQNQRRAAILVPTSVKSDKGWRFLELIEPKLSW